MTTKATLCLICGLPIKQSGKDNIHPKCQPKPAKLKN